MHGWKSRKDEGDPNGFPTELNFYMRNYIYLDSDTYRKWWQRSTKALEESETLAQDTDLALIEDTADTSNHINVIWSPNIRSEFHIPSEFPAKDSISG